MRWNRITLKLGGTIILLFLIILLPLGFVINEVFTGFYYSKVQAEIDQLSIRYAESMAKTQNPVMIKMMAEFSDIQVYIADADGIIIAGLSLPNLNEGEHIAEEELQQLLAKNSVFKRYHDPDTGQRYLVVGQPIINDRLFYGGMFVLSSVGDIEQSIQKVRNMLMLSGIGAFFMALGFTFVLSRKLSDPLIQMELATRHIAKGDLETRVAVLSGDEMGSLAAAINDLAAELQRYRDSRSEFFANISHELRTPMTYLEGYAKVVREGLYQTEEEKDRYLVIIHQETIRLTHLINDLFELSKMEEGKVNLHFEWIDLSEIMDNVASKARLKAKDKGLAINVRLPIELPLVYADGFRLEQVIINLVDNAIRYTMHGSVCMSVETCNNDHLRILIEDTGMGIPEDELPYIFERFYRVEKSRSREFGGTGLGLAIVKKLVEMQGGSIHVYSKIRMGTRIEINLPVTEWKEGNT